MYWNIRGKYLEKKWRKKENNEERLKTDDEI